mmetsp:Transcript_122013/g.340162  ORF Transcript_122013/g.340162 Transcript_122013/m.340162 type:complete len:106 (-) Transcript_122013:521-838(-)
MVSASALATLLALKLGADHGRADCPLPDTSMWWRDSWVDCSDPTAMLWFVYYTQHRTMYTTWEGYCASGMTDITLVLETMFTGLDFPCQDEADCSGIPCCTSLPA